MMFLSKKVQVQFAAGNKKYTKQMKKVKGMSHLGSRKTCTKQHFCKMSILHEGPLVHRLKNVLIFFAFYHFYP